MKRIFALVLALTLFISSVQAITWGEPDVNNQYPWVGLVISPAPSGGFTICSGSLISPTVFLTAAHCLDNDAPYFVTFKQDGPYNIANDFIPGSRVQHPNWTGAFTVPNTSDVGVVILSQAQPGPYGQLATENFIDELLTRRGTQDLTFATIGYGLQNSQNANSNRPQEPWDLARWFGFQRLLQSNSAYTDGFNIQLTNNPGLGNGVGGNCSGDSGGPIMHVATGQIVAVNSFGVAPYCRGTDYTYRVDTAYAREFLAGFVTLP